MDAGRRLTIAGAAAVPAILLTGRGTLAGSRSFSLLLVSAGALAAGAAATALPRWTLPSVRETRGGPAVLPLAWGVCVLAGAADATTTVVSVEMMKSGTAPGGAHESFGWFAYSPLTGPSYGRAPTPGPGPGMRVVSGAGLPSSPDWGATTAGVLLGWGAVRSVPPPTAGAPRRPGAPTARKGSADRGADRPGAGTEPAPSGDGRARRPPSSARAPGLRSPGLPGDPFPFYPEQVTGQGRPLARCDVGHHGPALHAGRT